MYKQLQNEKSSFNNLLDELTTIEGEYPKEVPELIAQIKVVRGYGYFEEERWGTYIKKISEKLQTSETPRTRAEDSVLKQFTIIY